MRKNTEKTHINGRTTYLSRLVAFAIFLTLVPVSHSQADVDQGPAGGSQTQELVDQLKELIRGAERDQRSSPWLKAPANLCAVTTGRGKLRFCDDFAMAIITAIRLDRQQWGLSGRERPGSGQSLTRLAKGVV
jgi:hypothetical protein